jgi:hypothetical protein
LPLLLLLLLPQAHSVEANATIGRRRKLVPFMQFPLVKIETIKPRREAKPWPRKTRDVTDWYEKLVDDCLRRTAEAGRYSARVTEKLN